MKNRGAIESDLLKETVIMNMHGKVRPYARTSLFVYDIENPVRKGVIWVLEHPFFEWFILLVIILNTIKMPLYDYSDRDSNSFYNQIMDNLDAIFTAIYAVEAALKIMAYGLIWHRNSYLREFWNILDFIVALTGYVFKIELILFYFRVLEYGLRNENYTELRWIRTIRVLRPLKTANVIPDLKYRLEILFFSLPNFFNVFVLMLFFYVLMSIIGMH